MNETIVRIMLDILVIVVILLGILWKIVANKKNNPGEVDLEMIPGHSKECQDRGEAITRLEENYKFVVKGIHEINTNVANIWKYLRKNGTG